MFYHDWLDLPSKSLLYISLQWQSNTSQRWKSCQIVFSHIMSTGILIFQWHTYDSPVCCRLSCVNSKYCDLTNSMDQSHYFEAYRPSLRLEISRLPSTLQLLSVFVRDSFWTLLCNASCLHTALIADTFDITRLQFISLRLYVSCLCAWCEVGGGVVIPILYNFVARWEVNFIHRPL